MKKIVCLKYLAFLIPTILICCCKYDYNFLEISNATNKDKFIMAYAIEDSQKYRVSGKNKIEEDFNVLEANGKTELIFTAEESFILEKEPREKNLIIYFYNSEKDSKNKKLLKNTIFKSYSYEELKNQNWKINFDENQ